MNPYTHQAFLFVANSDRAALGQFMRDYGDLLGGFAGGDDAEMIACSQTGQGPPDGWAFASWVTAAQALAFATAAWPVAVAIATHEVGIGPEFDDWLAALSPPMLRIPEDDA